MNPELQDSNANQPLAVQPPVPTTYASKPTASQPPKNNRLKPLLIGVVLLMVIAGVAAYAVNRHSKNQNTSIGGSASLNGTPATVSTCIPIISNTLDSTSSESTYERFAKAIADKNQTCADGLSTSFFIANAKQEFNAPDGKWITARVAGNEPMADDFSQLPAILDSTKFTQRDYTRATVVGSTNQTPVTGNKLSYPIDISKYTGDSSQKSQASISVVLDRGSVKVDDLVIEPQTK